VASEILRAWLPFLIVAAIGVSLMLWSTIRLRKVQELPFKLTGPADSITVGRDKQLSAFLRGFLVVIDGSVVGSIRTGEIKHFPVAPGPHTVATKIDWCTSAPLSVEKRANENTSIRCGVKSNFAAFVQPRHYGYVKNDG
jgi:hypothetical protein